MTMTTPERYGDSVLSSKWHGERERLVAMAEVADPTTTRILRDLGLRRDWRCLEIGAGAGTVATWLAAQATDGSVLATDIDTRWLAPATAPNLISSTPGSAPTPSGRARSPLRCGDTDSAGSRPRCTSRQPGRGTPRPNAGHTPWHSCVPESPNTFPGPFRRSMKRYACSSFRTSSTSPSPPQSAGGPRFEAEQLDADARAAGERVRHKSRCRLGGGLHILPACSVRRGLATLTASCGSTDSCFPKTRS